MNIDFYYAIIIGWSVLALFWSGSLIFILIRKPPNSQLTPKVFIFSIIFFIIGYCLIYIFS